MGQTSNLFPKLKLLSKIFLINNKFKFFAKEILSYLVDYYAKLKKFNFPEKFNWEWKLEMLLNKYEEETVKELKNIIKPGMVMIDIGAHIGYYSRFFAKLVGSEGKVYAFEANRDNYNLLIKNCLPFPQVTVYNQAITDKNGEIEFYVVNNSTGCHSVIPQDNAEREIVESTTIDQFIKANGISRIDLIKIDIEGAEALAFKGMSNLFSCSKNLIVVAEFNPSALRLGGVVPIIFLDNLVRKGFALYQITKKDGLKSLNSRELDKVKWHRTGYINILIKK